jgi:hypothetical protein
MKLNLLPLDDIFTTPSVDSDGDPWNEHKDYARAKVYAFKDEPQSGLDGDLWAVWLQKPDAQGDDQPVYTGHVYLEEDSEKPTKNARVIVLDTEGFSALTVL